MSVPANDRSRKPRTIDLLMLAMSAVLGFLALINFSYIYQNSINPSDTSMPESAIVFSARQVMEGKPLYDDYRQAPFIVAPYTPLYYYATSWLGKLAFPHSEVLHLAGRLISGFSMTAIMAIFFWLGWSKYKSNPVTTLFMVVPFWALPFLYPWAATARPDMLGLFFALGGILVWINFEEKPWRFLAIALFLLAFLTKQSFLAAPGALLLYLAIKKKKTDSLMVGGLFAGGVVAALLIMDSATGGLSTLNILGSNLVPLSFTNLRLIGGRFLQSAAFPLLLALAGLNRERMKSLPFLYFIVSLAWAFYASLKLGSDLNYFLEPMAAACLLIPFTLETMEREEGSRLPAVLLTACVIWAVPQINYRANALETLQFEDEIRVRPMIKGYDGLILTDSPRLAYLSKSPFLIDPYQLASLQTAGKWDAGPLLQMLEEGKVGMAILKSPPEAGSTWQGHPRLPKGVPEIIQRHFVRTEILDGFLIYRYRSDLP